MTQCYCHCHSELNLQNDGQCRCIKNCIHCHPENFPSNALSIEEIESDKEQLILLI